MAGARARRVCAHATSCLHIPVLLQHRCSLCMLATCTGRTASLKATEPAASLKLSILDLTCNTCPLPCSGHPLQVSGCSFTDGLVQLHGGAMRFVDIDTPIKISNCTFINNLASRKLAGQGSPPEKNRARPRPLF